MKWQSTIGFALLALGLGGSWLGAQGQKAAVIFAGQMFDGKSDRLLSNQVILIESIRSNRRIQAGGRTRKTAVGRSWRPTHLCGPAAGRRNWIQKQLPE